MKKVIQGGEKMKKVIQDEKVIKMENVILSEAKNLHATQRFFASLRMTAFDPDVFRINYQRKHVSFLVRSLSVSFRMYHQQHSALQRDLGPLFSEHVARTSRFAKAQGFAIERVI